MAYKDADLLTLRQISERFGISEGYLWKLAGPTNGRHDPNLYRLRVDTDESYRKAFNTQAKHVFPYAGVRAWYRERQERGWVIGAAKRNNS
jgi:hypothetical protein